MNRLNEIKRQAKTSPLLEKGLKLESEVSRSSCHSNLNYLKSILETKKRATRRECVGTVNVATPHLHRNL